MPRSAIINHDNTKSSSSSPPPPSTTTNDISNHQHKRSLEDYGFLANLKRRRHLSPQNSNIDLNNDNEPVSSSSSRKKSRTKSKNQSLLNTSLDSPNDHQTPRKTSSRHTSTSLSSQQMNEISLPNWERMCPNIDQILSNKHAQSGVFAHEVQLVQQELEALLSMSIVRENILKDLSKPSVNHSDTIRSKIRKHQEAERVYSMKKIPKKPLPSLTNHQRQNGSPLLLDRQVAIAPILGARIDRIWSDINTYHHKISSNDISTVENLVEFHSHLQTKIEQFHTEYTNQSNLIEQLNEETYEPLMELSQVNPLISHYVDRTTLGAFQSKLYEHIGQTSPVYKTPISSPMHGRMLGNNGESKDHVRISPRLHSNHKIGIFSLPNLKFDDDQELTSSLIKSKKKSKFLPSPSSAVKFQQRLQMVQNYLIDQHPIMNEAVKRQLFTDQKSTKKRKSALSISIPTRISNNNNDDDHCTDIFQSKLSTLESLVHECSILSSCALKRARLRSDNEQTWQKLNTIERDLENLIEKLDTPGGGGGGSGNHNSNTEKACQNLAQLLTDWNKYEEEFDQQLDELLMIDQ